MNKKLKIKGVNLNYTINGEGQSVILMHGWGCNLTTLLSIEKNLVPNFKVYNIDFPGFGQSEEPPTIWGVQDYAQMFSEFVMAEGIENPILLGHSFGGRVGIIYAAQHPVKKLILVDAAGVKPGRTLKYYYKVYTYKTVKHLLPLIFGKEKGSQLLDKYRGKAGSSDYNNASPKMRRIMSKVVNEDLKSFMPKIKCPTLLIWGENDTATPLKDAKTMEKLIPDVGLVSFPGIGHYSFLDNPYGFNAVLQSFLKPEMNKK